VGFIFIFIGFSSRGLSETTSRALLPMLSQTHNTIFSRQIASIENTRFFTHKNLGMLHWIISEVRLRGRLPLFRGAVTLLNRNTFD
jgi:uncharacterized protein with PQ loop repeat